MGIVKFVVAAPIILFLVVLVIGSIRSRSAPAACCAPADPRRDLRMRAAFDSNPVDHESRTDQVT